MQRPKNRTKFSLTPMMDFRSKIREIMEAVACNRHKVPIGVPCFHVPRDNGGYHAGLCSERISQLFNGQITDSSLSNKRPKKEHT